MKPITQYMTRIVLTQAISGLAKCTIHPLGDEGKRIKLYETKDSTPCKINTRGTTFKVTYNGKTHTIDVALDTRGMQPLINSLSSTKDETTLLFQKLVELVVKWSQKVEITREVIKGSHSNEVAMACILYDDKNKQKYKIYALYEYNNLLHVLQCKLSLEYRGTVQYLNMVQLDLEKEKEDYLNKYMIDLNKPINDIRKSIQNIEQIS